MRSLFTRVRHGETTPLEADLVAARPQPSERLVGSIVGMVRQRREARPVRLRLAFAGVLTATLVAVAASVGGVSHAASAISHLTNVVNLAGRTQQSLQPVPSCSQYAVAPIVSGISPSSGPVGTTVVITGSHFSGSSAVTSVTFYNGVSASFTINSDTQITTTVPVGAQTGPITVTNCKGSSSSGTFAVTNVPANQNACKNNGWKTRTRADGSTFKNQGDCIQYVNTGK